MRRSSDKIPSYHPARNSTILGTTTAGLLFILLAIIIPSANLIQYIRTLPPGESAQLVLGGSLFRIGLVVLGITLIVLPRLPIWYDETSGEVSEKKADKYFSLLLLLLAGSFVLRMYELNAGLWLDEILTHVQYARLSFGEIVTTFDSENQHFLFTLLAHASYLLFGESAWALRLPAVLFGVGSILALYLLGREVASPMEGILAATLMAFTYHHVWFSQNARGYTGLLFWTIFSSWLFVRGLSTRRNTIWITYAIASALGVYTHLTMGFILAAHFIIFLTTLIVKRADYGSRGWVDFLLAFGLTGLFVYLLHSLPLPQIVTGMAGTESVVEEWRNPLWTLLELIRGLRISFASGFLAVGAILLFVAGLYGYLRTRPVVIWLLILPPAIGATLVIAAGHHLWPRFFFFAFGFGALVVIRGVMVISNLFAEVVSSRFSVPEKRLVWIGPAVCVLMILVSALSVPFAFGPKQDYGAALDFIRENIEPGDAVATTYLADFVYDQYYHTGWEQVDSIEKLNQIRSQANRTWIVYTFEPVLESVNPDILQSIQGEFSCMREFPGSVGSGEVFVCRADNPPFSAAK